MSNCLVPSRDCQLKDTHNLEGNPKRSNQSNKSNQTSQNDNSYMEKKKQAKSSEKKTHSPEQGRKIMNSQKKKKKLSNDERVQVSTCETFVNEDNYTTYENLSVKELSDEEVISENEYNKKIKQSQNGLLISKEFYDFLVSNDDDQANGKCTKNDARFEELVQNEANSPPAACSTKVSHNVDEWINKLLKCELLHMEEVKLMCTLLRDILKEEPNCVQVSVPVTVAGDIHGQFYDLLELFHIGGFPPDVNYLFLGDYVDRGYYSCECFCLVACLKIKYPSRVTILRGNHESRQITKVYGFYDECMRKYNGDYNAWRYITDAFDYLPLTAIIGNQIFCDHGGISPYLHTINQINDLDRFKEIPQDGPICDLLWSDPAGPEDGIIEGWKASPRGAGVVFSEERTNAFLRQNKLSCICRAHQLVQDGFLWMHNDKVVTIFSAPNYCYRCGNSASLMLVDEYMEKDFVTFNTAPLRANAKALRRNVGYML
ncbi:Serine/threonine-protein phosphatase [Plasmodium coatneyi]|uniref:Serine/threonine-protein phosphatase n=1 Tax=Plasmodium coatneyi TaxID=208452 RepID=A0A1B1DY13_9APIC|nr:Serine/threonine-protein phosphatase [Plasmodium coatneyi]ANQ07485.1 Serine/threonine-protein phosphatase [Plasmodium coatneyi]